MAKIFKSYSCQCSKKAGKCQTYLRSLLIKQRTREATPEIESIRMLRHGRNECFGVSLASLPKNPYLFKVFQQII